LPVYQLSHPRRIHPSMRGNTSAHVVVTAEGLAGDFGKDPRVAPLLAAVVGTIPMRATSSLGAATH